jgi:hypothetical protein
MIKIESNLYYFRCKNNGERLEEEAQTNEAMHG